MPMPARCSTAGLVCTTINQQVMRWAHAARARDAARHGVMIKKGITDWLTRRARLSLILRVGIDASGDEVTDTAPSPLHTTSPHRETRGARTAGTCDRGSAMNEHHGNDGARVVCACFTVDEVELMMHMLSASIRQLLSDERDETAGITMSSRADMLGRCIVRLLQAHEQSAEQEA